MGRMMMLLCESPFQNESVDHVLGLSKAAIARDTMSISTS